MSNFPLSYRLSWLPRLLTPSLGGDRQGFAAPAGAWLEAPAERSVRLAFVGDISAVANRVTPVVHPEIRELLASADLVVGNCESPVVERPRCGLGTRLGIRHAMSAPFLGETLAAAGIDREKLVLSVANNHALDQGVEGFDETLAALRQLGIRVIGLAEEPMAKIAVPTALRQAPYRHAPTPLWGGGALTVGFSAFTRWRNAEASKFAGRVATESDPTSWPRDGIPGCDLVCAVPHWDWEFRHFPRAETRALARRLTDAGAGLIVGGHAHVVEPVERMGSTLVAYGLGDFLGTAFSRQPWPGRIGFVLAVDVGLEGDTRGLIAGYRCHPFFRLGEGRRERLVPVGTLEGNLRSKVARRFGSVMGAAAA